MKSLLSENVYLRSIYKFCAGNTKNSEGVIGVIMAVKRGSTPTPLQIRFVEKYARLHAFLLYV